MYTSQTISELFELSHKIFEFKYSVNQAELELHIIQLTSLIKLLLFHHLHYIINIQYLHQFNIFNRVKLIILEFLLLFSIIDSSFRAKLKHLSSTTTNLKINTLSSTNSSLSNKNNKKQLNSIKTSITCEDKHKHKYIYTHTCT